MVIGIELHLLMTVMGVPTDIKLKGNINSGQANAEVSVIINGVKKDILPACKLTWIP